MSKHLDKQLTRLKKRRAGFERLSRGMAKRSKGFKNPGSMNSHKSLSVRTK